MNYTGSENFDHGQVPRTGVLVTNLGTPDAPDRGALRAYLKEFLWDPRVVEIPRPLWWLILNGVILNVRPARSAVAYSSIWTDEGSPLLVHTRAQAQALGNALAERHGDHLVVDFAMRYGNPSIPAVLQRMFDRGVRRLVVLPLYPQYSCATTASTFDALAQDFTRRRWLPELRFVSSYHDHPAYIDALAASVESYQAEHGRPQKLLLSFHGEPRRYLDRGDPYHCQCHATSRLLAERLRLGEGEYLTTFQSRFGKAEWLRPYTDEVLKSLPREGVKSVQVVCPGFAADCLETLEEIDVENRGYFLDAGGESFGYIPCLNDNPDHIEALATIATAELGDCISSAHDPDQTRARALALGAKE